MPLHYQIPLCNIKYVGVQPSSGAVFRYDTRENITKNKTKLFYKKNETEINKIEVKSFYDSTIKINKNDSKNIIVNIDNEAYKNTEINLDKVNKSIYKTIEKGLNSIEKEITKENLLAINSNNIEIDMLKNKNLLSISNIELSKEYKKQFNRDVDHNLDNSNKIINLKNVSAVKGINIESTIELDRIFRKGINIKSNIELDRAFEKGMGINSNVNVETIRQHTLDKNKSIYLDKEKEKGLDIRLNNKYVDINITKDIDIKDNILNVDRINKKKVDILTSIYLDRKNRKEISKLINSKLAYKTNNFKLHKYNYIDIEKDNVKNIIKPINTRLFYINNLKRISKVDNAPGLNKDIIKNTTKYSSVGLNKDIIKDITKYNCINLNKDKIIKVFKNKSNFLQDIGFKNIFKYSSVGLNKTTTEIHNRINMKELNKPRINIYDPYVLKGLNKPRTDIYIPYTTTDLEVIKRWWVLGATSPMDKKILPYDYNYSKPLSINRRDREYGNMIDQSNHPISFMPYLENNIGIDLNYGLDEMALSIEIMLDMVNIVGMIVQHSASQFANCSGQEAIEFIMEVLLDWLNLDTTVQEMNLKGSREHYLRCYRWIRWESEKVWFKADKDHTQDRMMGVKYSGMLFANLLDYMKYHHFDLVPLWRNLKYMDIERQFNRTATNGDIIRDLDKLKGKRHYYIETQNFERKNILGGM